jgi:NTP pyrophosphatase (non-canonical NTP hydrolase)
MTFEEYHEGAKTTAIYPNKGNNFIYPTLGLAGETGELVNKIKKVVRGDTDLTPELNIIIQSELGDVLWYADALATELGVSLSDIADENLKKLASRMDRNKLMGNGDKR